MSEKNFQTLETTIRRLYTDGQYAEIITLIEQHGADYPDQRLCLTYWQIGAAARMGKPTLACYFMDTLLDDGLWISQVLLRQSLTLESLQGLADFEQRVRRFGELQAREGGQLLPLLILRRETQPGPGRTPYPLLIGLHKDRGIALSSIKFWQPAATRGWLVGAPQSTQALWSGAYMWEDRERAQREIEAHLHDLTQKYAIDHRRVLLAGHRNGGEMAAWLPLSGGIDARGFIAIGPTGPFTGDPNQWIRLLQARFPKNIRGAIILGENDPLPPRPELHRMVEVLNVLDVPCRLEIVPGAGGDFHPAYEPAILRAIDFVLT